MSNPELGFQGYSGRLGQWKFQRRNGRIVVSRVPTGRRLSQSEQTAVHRTFQAAASYARGTRDNQAKRTFYEPFAVLRRTSPYQAAMADYLRAPSVRAIGLESFSGAIGSRLTIDATDDTKVTSVSVEIRGADGTVLESGPATMGESLWEYATTVAYPSGTPVTILATAMDYPGHTGTLTVTWS